MSEACVEAKPRDAPSVPFSPAANDLSPFQIVIHVDSRDHHLGA